MTIQEVLRVRTVWKEFSVDPMCYHPVIGPIRDNQGILTGTYVCTRCGAEVLSNKSSAATSTLIAAVTP